MTHSMIDQLYEVNDELKSVARQIRNMSNWYMELTYTDAELEALFAKAAELSAKVEKRYAKQIAACATNKSILRKAFEEIGMEKVDVENQIEMMGYYTGDFSILTEVLESIEDVKKLMPTQHDIVKTNKLQTLEYHRSQVEKLEAELAVLQ